MSTFDVNMTLGDLVTQRSGRARVLEGLGLDYCCGGQQTLAQACADKGLVAADVVQALADSDAGRAADECDWSAAPLEELIANLLSTHHAFLKREFPRLSGLVDKVASVHGERHPELAEVRTTYHALRDELEVHLEKEENILFPMITDLERNRSLDCLHCGSVQNPIRVMHMEHESAGAALHALRELTRGYAVPADACGSFRAMLGGLAELESDLHVHIHKENNILFPKAIRLEEDLNAFR